MWLFIGSEANRQWAHQIARFNWIVERGSEEHQSYEVEDEKVPKASGLARGKERDEPTLIFQKEEVNTQPMHLPYLRLLG